MGNQSKKSTDASKKSTAASSNDSPTAVQKAKKATLDMVKHPQKTGRRTSDRD
ncbi:hypothetical protein [Schlesneria sp. T3-172]|uniref:hypothetical protein n=1 Tax=Schlesneria sphaerica TaxID=3373610 RepID=UPI0037C7CFD0